MKCELNSDHAWPVESFSGWCASGFIFWTFRSQASTLTQSNLQSKQSKRKRATSELRSKQQKVLSSLFSEWDENYQEKRRNEDKQIHAKFQGLCAKRAASKQAEWADFQCHSSRLNPGEISNFRTNQSKQHSREREGKKQVLAQRSCETKRSVVEMRDSILKTFVDTPVILRSSSLFLFSFSIASSLSNLAASQMFWNPSRITWKMFQIQSLIELGGAKFEATWAIAHHDKLTKVLHGTKILEGDRGIQWAGVRSFTWSSDTSKCFLSLPHQHKTLRAACGLCFGPCDEFWICPEVPTVRSTKLNIQRVIFLGILRSKIKICRRKGAQRTRENRYVACFDLKRPSISKGTWFRNLVCYKVSLFP